MTDLRSLPSRRICSPDCECWLAPVEYHVTECFLAPTGSTYCKGDPCRVSMTRLRRYVEAGSDWAATEISARGGKL